MVTMQFQLAVVTLGIDLGLPKNLTRLDRVADFHRKRVLRKSHIANTGPLATFFCLSSHCCNSSTKDLTNAGQAVRGA